MTLKVEPPALRVYAAQLATARQAAETAKNYVHANGDFSLHQKGAIGVVVPFHRNYLDALTRMLDQVARVLDASHDAMTQLAAGYEHSDRTAAEALDASYPVSPRPPASHEAQEQNIPMPPRNTQ
jgi:Excreted virulence factor EspC, type VII ESX diderm